MSSPLTDKEIGVLERVAVSRAKRWRVDPDDAVQQAWVECLHRMHDVARYRQMGERGERSFRLMVSNAADRGCKAAFDRPPQEPGAFTADQVKTLLEVVWSVEDWPQPGVAVYPSGARAVSQVDPGRVEDAWAHLHDLSTNLMRLRSTDRKLLWLRWGAGLTNAEAAERCGLEGDAAEVRASNAVKRLARLMGRGERS